MDVVSDAKPVKVLYKDPEGINTFCINKVSLCFIVLGSSFTSWRFNCHMTALRKATKLMLHVRLACSRSDINLFISSLPSDIIIACVCGSVFFKDV